MDLKGLQGVQLVAEVRCPHKVGLCYFTPAQYADPAYLSNLPCECNDRSDVLRLFAEIGSLRLSEETKS